jgi:hypothetical protein
MFGLGQSMLGLALIAMALIHFAQRRPNTYWLWIILMFPGIGALVYLLVEAVPDVTLLRGTFQVFPRRRRIRMLQGLILDNPSVGNLEELGELLLEDKQYAKAKEMFDRVITPRTDSPDPYYRRGLAEIGTGDLGAAVADLDEVVRRDPKYDYHRAAGLLADTLARSGQKERAAALFAEVTEVSTLSETQYNYASFLASEGRTAEAREWAQRILNKRATMPSYMRRRERPWFWKATALQKRLSVKVG